MKKFQFLLIVTLALLPLLNSCEEEDKPKIIFSICNFEDQNPMTDAIVKGCQMAIDENDLSKSYDIILDHQVYPVDSASFGEEFLKLGNSANFRLIKGIMAKPMNSKKVDNIINQVALGGGIVYTFDNDAPKSLRYTYFGLDYYEIGRVAAETCMMLGTDIDKVAFVISEDFLISEQAAFFGFKDNFVFQNHDNILLFVPWDKKEAQRSIEVLADNEELDCVFIIQNSFFDENYSLPYGLKSKFVIAIGGFPAQYEDLKNGRIDMIIAYNPFDLGKKMMKSMIDLSLLDIEPSATNIVPYTIVDISNADEWYKIWE